MKTKTSDSRKSSISVNDSSQIFAAVNTLMQEQLEEANHLSSLSYLGSILKKLKVAFVHQG